MNGEQADPSERWRRRPAAARAVRAGIFALPVAFGFGVAWLLHAALPASDGGAAAALRWLFVAAISAGVVVASERVARRFLPLAYLLDLAMLFPGDAPSRFRTALRAGSIRRLRDDLEAAGEDATPERVAGTILSLAAALSAHDRRTRGHSERVRAYAEMLAESIGVAGDDLDRLRWAALLHDLGKLSVPAGVLNKDGRPDPDEWEIIRRHPTEGARLAGPLLGWLGPWSAAIAQHHEHFDGQGYPAGIVGDDIGLAARIVAIADAFETMTAPRSYRNTISAEAARDELARCAGTQFDPELVRAFVGLSIARVRRAAGPLAILLQLPFLRPVHAFALTTAGKTAAVAGVAVFATASTGMSPGPVADLTAAPSPGPTGSVSPSPGPGASASPRTTTSESPSEDPGVRETATDDSSREDDETASPSADGSPSPAITGDEQSDTTDVAPTVGPGDPAETE